MGSSMSSPATSTIVKIVIGIASTVAATITVWQGHQAWKMWHGHNREAGGQLQFHWLALLMTNISKDIELGDVNYTRPRSPPAQSPSEPLPLPRFSTASTLNSEFGDSPTISNNDDHNASPRTVNHEAC